MKDIIRILVRIILLAIILLLVTRVFQRADEKLILSPDRSFYSRGDAPDSIRLEITGQLNKFQDGYSERDVKNIDSFMESLYSRDNILILGTMPSEVYSGYERATRLVRSDWEGWGDVRFQTDSACISSSGNTAWFATKGFVEFDMSRFLVLPLRLTGVMVKEDQVWKFRQQQFQFDVDFTYSLVAVLVLSVWILVSLITLAVRSIRMIRKRS
jgi:hypothetical protein